MRHPDPFAAMQQASSHREPLKEWWEQLTAPRQQTQSADAPVPEPAFVTQEETVPQPAAAADPAPAADSGPALEHDEALDRAANRLSGLRNLLTSLGIQTLHQGMEQRKIEAQADARVLRTPERAIDAQPVNPIENSSLPEDSVTARPEIIPPRLQAATAEPERVPKDPRMPVKSPRVWESPDDLDTLPARKGQYRRNQ